LTWINSATAGDVQDIDIDAKAFRCHHGAAPPTMSETAAVMEACNPMRDCHAGSVLATGDDARGTSYQVPIAFTRF
jgi:hypothetical protein